MPSIYLTPGAQGSIPITLASLATSSTLLVGRASDAVASGNWADAVVSGSVMPGTSPTSGTEIRVYVYAQRNDTPTYPSFGVGGNISGLDAGVTFSSSGVRDAALYRARVIGVNETTSNVPYTVPPFSLVQVCGFLPKRWGLFVTHNTAVTLNATPANHQFVYLPYTLTY